MLVTIASLFYFALNLYTIKTSISYKTVSNMYFYMNRVGVDCIFNYYIKFFECRV